MKKITYKSVPSTIYALFLIAGLTMISVACRKTTEQAPQHFVTEQGMVWNTQYHVTYAGSPDLRDSIRNLLDDLGRTLSVFDSTSLVSRVNREDSVPVNTDFIRVYVQAKKISRKTDGAFDPTLSPLITVWGFGPGHTVSPDTAAIDSILQFVGIESTHLRNDRIYKDDIRTQFNFSAIAKGYACDRVGELLESMKVKDYLIEIGGEIKACGNSPRGEKWNVSIDRPIFSDSILHESQLVISFTDMGLATSGNYRNFRTIDSVRYGHTISLATGRPAETDILSASVLAPTAMEADGWATAFMAMGSEKSIRMIDRMRLPVMLVLPDTVWMSKQFEKLILK